MQFYSDLRWLTAQTLETLAAAKAAFSAKDTAAAARTAAPRAVIAVAQSMAKEAPAAAEAGIEAVTSAVARRLQTDAKDEANGRELAMSRRSSEPLLCVACKHAISA